MPRRSFPQWRWYSSSWRIVERVVRAAEVRAPLVEEQPQDLRVLLELVLALADRRERQAVRRELRFVPADAEPAVGTPAREVIDGAHGLGEHAGMAVADAEDETAHANSRRLERECGEARQRLEAVAVAALRRRFLEVVGDGEPVEAVVVGEAPETAHLGERSSELAQVDAELDRSASDQ